MRVEFIFWCYSQRGSNWVLYKMVNHLFNVHIALSVPCFLISSLCLLTGCLCIRQYRLKSSHLMISMKETEISNLESKMSLLGLFTPCYQDIDCDFLTEILVVSVKATACWKCRRILCYSKLSSQNVFNSWVRSVPLNTVITESLWNPFIPSRVDRAVRDTLLLWKMTCWLHHLEDQ